MTVNGAVVGRVPDEELPALVRAGRAVWDHYYMRHTPIIMVARRME